jgi:hypothetical protein
LASMNTLAVRIAVPTLNGNERDGQAPSLVVHADHLVGMTARDNRCPMATATTATGMVIRISRSTSASFDNLNGRVGRKSVAVSHWRLKACSSVDGLRY